MVTFLNVIRSCLDSLSHEIDRNSRMGIDLGFQPISAHILFIYFIHDYLYRIATLMFETLLSVLVLFRGPGSI